MLGEQCHPAKLEVLPFAVLSHHLKVDHMPQSVLKNARSQYIQREQVRKHLVEGSGKTENKNISKVQIAYYIL
jgi:hypothetical protein